ncbi:hypothetical protein ALQ36_103012 [Pseudomonas syringae pv. primulae]|uniref:Uncharacterized protein n=1 Tax=Pseudomonas syringae pv. primulae TaxID=251707 RepID=A0A3M3YIF9_9PSED
MTRSVRQNAGGLGYIFAESANGAFKRGLKGWVMAGFCLAGAGAFGGYGGCEATLKPMHTVYRIFSFPLRVVIQFVTLCVTQRFSYISWMCLRLKAPFRPSASYFEGSK